VHKKQCKTTTKLTNEKKNNTKNYVMDTKKTKKVVEKYKAGMI